VLLAPRLLARFGAAVRVTRLLQVARQQRPADLERSAAYHAVLPPEPSGAPLDDRTWKDLDLDAVFVSLDHTASEPGRQVLYHVLRTPRDDAEPLERLERVVRELDGDDALRERARATLARLSDTRAGYFVDLLFGELPRRPGFWWIFPLLTAGAIACLALTPLWPRAVVVWVGICVVNVVVQVLYKPRVKRFIPALHELPAFVGVAASLAELPATELDGERRVLGDAANRLGTLRRATRWLVFEPGQANELAAMLYEYVNLLFLLDVNAFVFATEAIRDARTVMRNAFAAIGYVDAAQSIAEWRRTLPRWSTPEFTEPRKAVHVSDVVHPLLAGAVPNSLAVEEASVLITGSNMSGKTTFVRALGVSAVLAQTLHTVCATAWRAPRLRVRTSIGRTDSVTDGKSYYLAEAESVLALVRAKETGFQHLFLLDEIFRGTNTTERVAAGYAVLAYLDRGRDVVVVATHDLELLDLLGGTYVAHHFREHVEGDGLRFDYRIQPGPSSTRNAIALLRYMKYPDGVVADALAAIDWQHPAR
jgi:DNA mismatch repair ATPase MutS